MNAVPATYKIIFAALCMLIVSSSLYGQEEREYVRKGTRLYKKGEFAGSEGMYRRSMEQDKPFEDASFNLGDALYRQGRFGEAAAEFSRAAAASEGNSLKQSEGFYNLGNSLVKEQKFEESIEAYINSLKLNPDNIQAKYNLAWAQEELKKQQEQQKQQQDQEKNNDQQQDKNKEDQQDKKDQQQDQKDQEGQQQQQQQSISREDAKRLLDALAANEKETQEKVQRDKAAGAKVRVIKNW
jgi:tetratricopeptide (TPR) repeat protein